jgi:hypothetical protein
MIGRLSLYFCNDQNEIPPNKPKGSDPRCLDHFLRWILRCPLGFAAVRSSQAQVGICEDLTT